MQNKKQVHRLRIIWHILKVTGFVTFLTSFFSFIFLAAGLLLLLEPDFTSFWKACQVWWLATIPRSASTTP
ncbi:TPA: hypothetical protein ACGO28_000753 [Streptococcus suis]